MASAPRIGALSGHSRAGTTTGSGPRVASQAALSRRAKASTPRRMISMCSCDIAPRQYLAAHACCPCKKASSRRYWCAMSETLEIVRRVLRRHSDQNIEGMLEDVHSEVE